MGKKYVNVRRHPSKDYELRCYNKKAFFDRHWNEETINARGHVYDRDGNILSMPFPKFFNIDENQYSRHEDVCKHIYDNIESILIYPKYNGHLAIMFHDGDEWVVTTKGSFDHEFVELDRLVIEDSGFSDEVLAHIPTEWTLCFEIVADYDPHLMTAHHKEEFGIEKDFAILLGVNDRNLEHSVTYVNYAHTLGDLIYYDSGKDAILATPTRLADWTSFQRVEDVADHLAELKAHTHREGYIIHDVLTDWRIKVKTDWFVYERYKFQFNASRTRNIFSKYFDSEAAFEKIPEEFHNRYRAIVGDYATFLNGIEENMMSSMERIHDNGLMMRHEIEHFIQSNEKLTSTERGVMMAYVSNKGYEGRAFDMFCETYQNFSLVDRME